MNDRPDMAASPLAEDERIEAENERQPVFNLPGILTLTAGLLVALYVVYAYVPPHEEVEYWMTIHFAFIHPWDLDPALVGGMQWLWSPVTYSLLHGSVEHLVFNLLWLLAFGAPVVRRIGAVRYLAFWILSAAAAAFFHVAISQGEPTILIGASGVISALMGAACRFAFPARGGYDRTFGHLYPRQSIIGAFHNRTVVVFVGLWLAGNLLVAVGLPLVDSGSNAVAWDAHIGGFLFGYLLFGLFDRVR